MGCLRILYNLEPGSRGFASPSRRLSYLMNYLVDKLSESGETLIASDDFPDFGVPLLQQFLGVTNHFNEFCVSASSCGFTQLTEPKWLEEIICIWAALSRFTRSDVVPCGLKLNDYFLYEMSQVIQGRALYHAFAVSLIE